MKNKMIIYQVFTRLFGNDKTACIPHGNKTENGCGHFADFTQKALTEIQKLGATHIWYTGVIAHATQTDYTSYGISGFETPSSVSRVLWLSPGLRHNSL